MNKEKISVHQWTNRGDEVFILRCISRDGKSYGGFPNPLEIGATLTTPDDWNREWGPQPNPWRPGWQPDRKCGGGIHGWPWGIGIGDGKEPDWAALWQVYGVKPADVMGLEDAKCKFRQGVVRYSGDWHGAAMFLLSGQMAWTFHNASGSASNSGYRGSASNSGDSGSASNSGDSGSASNSGARGSASNSGDSGSAVSSVSGTAAFCTGLQSRVMAGPYSAIALAWWNDDAQRREMRAGEIGVGDGSDGKYKAGVWYVVNETGQIVEADK